MPIVEQALNTQDLEGQAIACAIQDLVPVHLDEVRRVREPLIARTIAAVQDRLTKEITYWDHRAEELKAQELTGRVNAKINSGKARQRADELAARLRARLAELTITKNEILTALNKPDDWLLALVEVPPAPDFGEPLMAGEARPNYGPPAGCVVKYVRRPFTREPDFGATSVNYNWRDLWTRGEAPA